MLIAGGLAVLRGFLLTSFNGSDAAGNRTVSGNVDRSIHPTYLNGTLTLRGNALIVGGRLFRGVDDNHVH